MALLEPTASGLYCPAGDLYIDPWDPVPRAIVTHAHSDHTAPGAGAYLATEETASLLQLRLGPEVRIETLPWGEKRDLGGIKISFHPAGHILGSAQVRLERNGEVLVVSGDYKLQRDPTTRPFVPLSCHTFVSECTFGLPIFRWDEPDAVFKEIHRWWARNRERGRTSILFAYSLGKAQRVLAGIDPSIGPIGVHGAVQRLLPAYERFGVSFPPHTHAVAEALSTLKGAGLVLAPPSARGTPWMRKLEPAATGFASGWMRIRGERRRRGIEQGIVLSDHADWTELQQAIEATGAEEIWLAHGFTHPLARALAERGRLTRELPTSFPPAEDDQPLDLPQEGS